MQEIWLTNPEVDHAAIAPHDMQVVVRIKLQQEAPFRGARPQLCGFGVFVPGCVATIEAVGGELALKGMSP